MSKSQKTLYIIHGWTYTTAPWERTIEILKKDYGIKVEMLNVPGLTATSYKVWTIADYVAWAAKNLPTGCIALGHSNGGRILLNLCVEQPNKLSHLILLNSAGVYEEAKKHSFLSKFFKISKKSSDHSPKNMKKTLKNMIKSDRQLNLSKITTPTTILWGEANTTFPLRQGELIHEKIKGSTLKTYKNWTHAPYIADPAGLASALAATLKEIETAKQATEATEATA